MIKPVNHHPQKYVSSLANYNPEVISVIDAHIPTCPKINLSPHT